MSSWSLRRLDQLADVSAGNPAPQGDANFDGGTLPFFRTSDVGRIHLGELSEAQDWLNELGAKGMRLHPAGTVLMPKSGASTFTDHRVITTRPGYVSSHLATIKADGRNACDRYLYYALQTISARDVAGDSNYPTLSLAQLKAIKIPAPPLAKQQRIVAILDEAFDGIEAAIANADRAVVNGTAIFEAARKSLLSNRQSSWTDQPIAAICDNLDGRRRPVTKGDRVPGNVPYYGASGVVDHVKTKLFDEDLLLVSEDGANLLARTYPIAFSIAGPSWVNNHAHVLRFADTRTQKFVEHFFNSIDLEPYVTGMAQPKLNQGELNKISVPLPPLDRQGDIVASLEQLQSETDNLMGIHSRKLTLLAELKRSLLARAFAGELTATVAPIVKDDNFATPEQAANILAFMYWRHEGANRGRFFGHVMGQKTLDLVERIGCVELGRTPYKDAAGPNDRAHMVAAERWAKQQGFFEFVERSGGGYDFKKLSNYDALLTAAKTALKPAEMQLARVADILVGKDTVEAEIFDTVLAAWNNLVADMAEASDAAIVYEARENWHPDKLAIPISKFQSAIQEIRRRSLVPDGTAKVVRHRQASLL